MWTLTDLTLADDRSLDLLLGGDPDGFPVVLHHGSPADATTWTDWDGAVGRAGLRLVAWSRPGYAGSDRAPGRTVAHGAQLAAEVLDRLGLDRFVTAGWSGGGPHALACGALLPDRCLAVASLAGVAPFDAAGLDWLDGMGPENVEEFGAAVEGEPALRSWLAANGEAMRQVTAADIVAAFGGLIPAVDAEALHGGYAEHMAAGSRRALAAGFDGWVDDDLAFAAPWGFDPADVAVPVSVWQGDLDLMVPVAHGRWLADRIPGALARMESGQGHLSLVVQRQGEILADLADRGGLPASGS